MTLTSQLPAAEARPTSKSIYSDPEAREILQFLLGNVQTLIVPEILQDDQIAYPQLESILGHVPSQVSVLFDRMVASGVLLAEVVDKIPVCPECGSQRVSTRYLCPQCNSYDIARGYLFEHLKCGKVGNDKSFQRDDEIVCPKCQTVLHNFGIEYRAVGAWYECSACKYSFNNPSHSHFCRPNRHRFSPESAPLIPIHQYRLNQAVLKEIKREVLLYSEAITILENLGLNPLAPHNLTGESGQQHTFDIVFVLPKKGWRGSERIIAIDVITSDTAIGPEPIHNFVKKVKDSMPFDSCLVATPGFTDEARMLAKNLRLTYVEGSTLKEAMQAFQRLALFKALLA
jgi:hypothetical protein